MPTQVNPNLVGDRVPPEHTDLLAVQGRLHARLRALNEGGEGGSVGVDWLAVFPNGVPADVLRAQLGALYGTD